MMLAPKPHESGGLAVLPHDSFDLLDLGRRPAVARLFAKQRIPHQLQPGHLADREHREEASIESEERFHAEEDVGLVGDR